MTGESEYIFTTTKTTTATATTTLPPTFDSLTTTLGESFVHYLNYLGKVPGGDWILWYIKASYKDDPIRSLFELALLMFGVHYFLRSKRKENKSDLVRLSKREVDDLIDEWKPLDLVEPVDYYERWQLSSIPLIKGGNKSYVELDNLTKSKKVANLASNDFLNLNENDACKEAANIAITNSGVGACSPPNFYGTQDFHKRLEEDLAEYLEADQAILYGQDFVTASSVLPAFVKRGDLCIVDTGVSIAIQKAILVSRCDIEWFNHNDMDHLESILEEIKPTLDKQKPLRRRFIVTEGLFANNGTIPNLPKLVELKNKFKYRVFLDETNSIGVIGKTGKGICEHFNIPRSEISITIGSLANSLASSGGFCVGAPPMIHHQKLSSLAYVFSAALPPYCAKTASQAIQEIKKVDNKGDSAIMKSLHDFTNLTYNALLKSTKSSDYIEIISDPNSAVIHLGLKPSYRKQLNLPEYYGSLDFLKTGRRSKINNPFDDLYNLENFMLQKIIDSVLVNSNILISRTKNLIDQENLPVMKPHLLIMIKVGVSKLDYDLLINTFNNSVEQVCSKVTSEYDLSLLDSEMKTY